MNNHRAEVDTTSPFHSVKEAVAIFGERIISGELKSHLPSSERNGLVIKKSKPPPPSPSFSLLSSNGDHVGQEASSMVATIRRMEVELEEIKKEVMSLKEKGSELEVVMSSLDAEIQKKSSKVTEEREIVSSDRDGRRDVMSFDRYMPSLAHHVFSLGEMDSHFENERRMKKEMNKMRKQKPIVPLVGDMFMSIKKKEKSEGSSPLKEDPHSLYTPFSSVLC